MNLFVHLIMAQSIRKNVRHATGKKLHLAGFLYGNILPDLAKRFDEFPHTMERSLPYISEAAADLCDHDESRSFSYSKNMGVITHYISDYFCLPHTSLFRGGLLKHLWYELRMMTSLRAGRNLAHRIRAAAPEVSLCDLAEKVIGLRNRYCRERSHSVHDIAYAIESSSAIASIVVRESATAQSALNLSPAHV